MPEDTQAQEQGTEQNEGQQQALIYDEWIKAQPPEVAAMLDQRNAGLLNSVQTTRQQREELSRRLKEASQGLEAEKAEARAAAQSAVKEISAQLEAAEVRAAFYEDAAKPEIGCTNARLAYIAAQQDNLIDSRGRTNWETLRQTYPELFRRAAPTTNAGAGTANAQPATGGMNAFIRRAAGRTT